MTKPVSTDYKNCVICMKHPGCNSECHQHDYDEFELDTKKIKKQGAE